MTYHTSTHGHRTGLPNVLRVLDAEGWRRDAACAGEADERLFFNEPPNAKYQPRLQSASLLLPMLICAGCPVRRPCLRAALDPPTLSFGTDDGAHTVQVYGIWGGSTEHDRYRVRHLPVAAAIDELERTLPDRIAERIAAWRAALEVNAGRGAKKRDRRIEAMLAGGVGRFHLGGPGGPGRGHRGPIAEYVALHRVSRDTAWRRLRAAS